MTERNANLRVVTDYLRAIEAKDGERVRALLHGELVQHEYPNQLVKAGASRVLEEVLDGLSRGSQVLTHERYDLEDILLDGDRVACRVRWRGTLAVAVLGKPPGDVLEARFGVFFRLREGQIIEQHNYDCFYV